MSTTTQIEVPIINDLFKLVSEKLAQGATAYTEAGKAVYAAVASHGTVIIDILQDRGIPSDVVKMLYQIGKNPESAQLVLMPHRAAKKLLACNDADRLKYQSEPIPVTDPTDTTQHRLIMFKELSADQIKQVFNCDHVRTLAEQRTYIEEHKQTVDTVKALPSYEIKRGKLFVLLPTEFNKEQLFLILAKMESI